MRSNLKRTVCLALCLCLLLPLLTTAVSSSELLPHFRDVPETAWYYEYVRACYEQGLMNGTADDLFSPKASLTRGMTVTVLGRAAKADANEYSGETGFTDVSPNQYYAPYVNWAKELGVVQGMTETEFAPNQPITREQTAVMLYRFALCVGLLPGEEDEDPPVVTEPEVTEPEVTEPEVTEPEITEPEVTEPEVTEPEVTEPEVTEPEVTEPEVTEPEVTEPEVTEPEVTEPEVTEPEVTEPEVTEPEEEEEPAIYVDEDSVAAWAKKAVRRVRDLGLMEGNEKGEFLPKQQLTRAEAAAVFIRLSRLLCGDEAEQVNEWFDREPDPEPEPEPEPQPTQPPVDPDPIPNVSNPIVSRAHLREVLNAHNVPNYSAVYYALISINTVYASRLSSSQRSKPMLFLFEGCGSSSSANLRLNTLAVVVKNGKIVYYNMYSSTIPDYPFDPSKNDGDAMPTICSGIYSVKTINHSNYAALQVLDAKVVRFTNKYNYFSSVSSGIHIHRRYLDTIPPYSYSWVNSCGCLLIGRAGASSTGEYAQFLVAFGLIPKGWAGNSQYRYSVNGTVIVDRRQAKSYLRAVGYPDGAINKIGINAIYDSVNGEYFVPGEEAYGHAPG